MRARPFALFLGEVIVFQGFTYLTQIPITKPGVVLLTEWGKPKTQTSQTIILYKRHGPMAICLHAQHNTSFSLLLQVSYLLWKDLGQTKWPSKDLSWKYPLQHLANCDYLYSTLHRSFNKGTGLWSVSKNRFWETSMGILIEPHPLTVILHFLHG